jgi:hypothetical protein
MESNSKITEFLNFDSMITPSIIKIIYIISTAMAAIFGLVLIITGLSYSGVYVLLGLIMIGLSPFITRIFCELLIIKFKNNEYLKQIANK